MRVRLPHSNGVFLSRWGTPLTDLRASVADGKRFCPGTCVPVSKIEGNLPCLGAKSIHFVGYLPVSRVAEPRLLSPRRKYPLDKGQQGVLSHKEPSGVQRS